MKTLCRLLCLMLWLPLTALSQPLMETSSAEPFSIRTLNTYEVLETPADLANHPLMNVEVTFTAVVTGIANNTGLPATSSMITPGLPRRLHLFVIDTMATEFGKHGMSMQIVEELMETMHVDMAPMLLSATRGTIMTFTGRLTSFQSQVQFDLTQMPILVGHVDEPRFAHHIELLTPHFVHSFMLNRLDSLTGVLVPDMDMYTGMAHSYVTLGSVMFLRYSAPGAMRPEWAASDPFGLVYLYDSSSRFRNDRAGLYGSMMNHRRLGAEDAFTPPGTGAMGEISGFVVYGSVMLQGMMQPTSAVIAPWYDGLLWNETGLTSPEWMPSDLVVDTTIVGEFRDLDVSLNVDALVAAGYFNPEVDRMYIRGSFNEWGLQPLNLTGVNTYWAQFPVSGAAGDTLEYKFYYERESGMSFNGGWELLAPDAYELNRVLLLNDPGVDLSVIASFAIQDVVPPPTRAITFRVDMRPLAEVGLFSPQLLQMYGYVGIAGSFSNWDILPMQHQDSLVWSTVVIMPGAEGDSIEYKFVYNQDSGPVYNYGYEIIDEREITENRYINRKLILGPVNVPMDLGVMPFGMAYTFGPTPGSLTFPITAEEDMIPWSSVIVNFEGGELTRVQNPDTTGFNTSAFALKMVKNPGMPWAGAFLNMEHPFDLMHFNAFRLAVLSPRAGAKLLFKIENATDGSINYELERMIPVANEWTELTFDFSQAPVGNVYQKIVLIFDLGIPGDGSPNFTFYVDNIRPYVTTPPPPELIPVYMYTTTRFAPGDGDGNWLYIGLGDENHPAEDLIGMGFSMAIDTNYAVPTAYSTLGMFDDGSDEDFLELVQLDEYALGASIVRTSGTNKMPYGPVFGFRFNVKSDIEWLNIGLYDIEIRDVEGNLVPFALRQSWIEIPTRSLGVWPGDANADGTVDVFDVDPIGYYYGTNGPGRQNQSIQWMMMDATIWPVFDAVYADGNGDGRINQNDLLPVGFNFGKTVAGPVTKTLADLPQLASPESFTLPLPAMRRGQLVEIPLFADRTKADVLNLRSVGLRVSLDTDLVTVRSATPPTWFTDPAMLKLVRSEAALNRFSAAFARTREMDAVSGPGAVITLLVEANADLVYGQATLTIDRAVLGFDTDRAMPVRLVVDEGTITSVDEPRAELPSDTRLEGNYPNPFNPSTMIAYALADDAATRLSVFDVLGREVAVLVDTRQSSGRYQVVFDATGLSSGLYLIRLQVGAETFTKSMTLVK